MRSLSRLAVGVGLGLLLAAPHDALAQARGSIEGFGGLSINSFESQPPSLGGRMTFDLIPHVQIVGEAGRVGDLLPTLASTVFDISGADLRASAWYGEGGVRVVAAPASSISPYGEATAGVARLDVDSPRLGAIGNAAASLALGLAGRTTPIAGVGAGFLVRGGPIVFDVGYRYKQLFPNDVLQAVLGFGQPLRAHQVRAGIGVRF